MGCPSGRGGAGRVVLDFHARSTLASLGATAVLHSLDCLRWCASLCSIVVAVCLLQRSLWRADAAGFRNFCSPLPGTAYRNLPPPGCADHGGWWGSLAG